MVFLLSYFHVRPIIKYSKNRTFFPLQSPRVTKNSKKTIVLLEREKVIKGSGIFRYTIHLIINLSCLRNQLSDATVATHRIHNACL